jgi:hypothetical protein
MDTHHQPESVAGAAVRAKERSAFAFIVEPESIFPSTMGTRPMPARQAVSRDTERGEHVRPAASQGGMHGGGG